jgi:signal transduction histidine kinase
MSSSEDPKYSSLRKIITAPSDPQNAVEQLQEALEAASRALGVEAAAIVLLDPRDKPVLEIRCGDVALGEVLRELEKRMIESLRSKFGLQNLYSTLNHDGEKSVFSYMIKSGNKNMGAVSGICNGSRNIALEEEFIEVIAEALKKVYGQATQLGAARLEAMRETTATLNHEINNPLTAVLGNVQLLLMKTDELPPEVIRRLQSIEEGSLRIRDVLSRMQRLQEAKSTTYVDDSTMIDLQDSSDSEEEE